MVYCKGGKDKGEKLKGLVTQAGYICPQCGCPDLSDERQFNLMFRSSLGSVDPLEDLVNELEGKQLERQELRRTVEEVFKKSAVYLRPETAQAMFVQFQNVQSTMSMKIPFGIAQQGKSFRNEITTERFIFRTCEFEQMEMEYFVEPGTQAEWHDYWLKERMDWWKKFANNHDNFRLREHEADELAHYSDRCFDIEYKYPWGWDELEGVASRTDYDLSKHTEYSKAKLTYFDPHKKDPKTGKDGWRYTPFVIEPAAGLTRGLLVYLCDAYSEEKGVDAQGKEKTRVVLKLNPKLAPIKTAVFPLVKKDGLPEKAREVVSTFYEAGINARCDAQHSIGKRYSRHDEAGTPYCLTVDHQTMEDGTVTIRDRDTTEQERISVAEAVEVVTRRISNS